MEWTWFKRKKGVSSLAIFKFKLRNMAINELYYYGPRSENIQLTRMQIQCSSLNAQLCFCLHVVNDAKYSCGFAEEDKNQFLL